MNKKSYTYRSQKQWDAILKRFEKSGMSKSAFCKENNIAINTFYKHYSKDSSPMPSASKEQAPAFLPVSVTPEATKGFIPASPVSEEIEVTIGKATIHVKPGFDRDLLIELISTLEVAC